MIISYSRLIILMIITTLALASCNRYPHKTVDAQHVDIYLKEHAETIYYELFKACADDSINTIVLRTYVSPKMQQQILNGEFKDLCKVIDKNVGEISSLELQEVVYFKHLLVAFRYKMKGTKLKAPIEFRLVLTIDNLLSSFGFYSWNNEYKYSTPILPWAKQHKL